jgi:hypothetical protein
MPLSQPVSRQLRHRRAIRLEAFEREDGLWDIEACLTDEKPRDLQLAFGVRPQGLPLHELWLRVTIDRSFNIIDAEASSEWAPYERLCAASNPMYQSLIGLNLAQNFRHETKRLLAGTTGCTHLTELCAVLPTAAIQAFSGEPWNTGKTGEKPPFQLGRCNALRFDGEAVKQFYPRWFGHAPRVASDRTDRSDAVKRKKAESA